MAAGIATQSKEAAAQNKARSLADGKMDVDANAKISSDNLLDAEACNGAQNERHSLMCHEKPTGSPQKGDSCEAELSQKSSSTSLLLKRVSSVLSRQKSKPQPTVDSFPRVRKTDSIRKRGKGLVRSLSVRSADKNSVTLIGHFRNLQADSSDDMEACSVPEKATDDSVETIMSSVSKISIGGKGQFVRLGLLLSVIVDTCLQVDQIST